MAKAKRPSKKAVAKNRKSLRGLYAHLSDDEFFRATVLPAEPAVHDDVYDADPLVVQALQQPSRSQFDNLVALVVRLSRRLPAGDKVAAQAMDYLRRECGYKPSILR